MAGRRMTGDGARQQPVRLAHTTAGEAHPHRFAILRRLVAGEAICAICRQAVRPEEDVVITPDFLADDTDPFRRFADTIVHRSCFLLWDERKAFVARYNRVARALATDEGDRPVMTSEGDVVWRRRASRPQRPQGGPRRSRGAGPA